MVIDEVLKKYGHIEPGKLVDISHKEYAWKNAGHLEPLSVEDMVHDLPDDQKASLLSRFYEDQDVDACLACVG